MYRHPWISLSWLLTWHPALRSTSPGVTGPLLTSVSSPGFSSLLAAHTQADPPPRRRLSEKNGWRDRRHHQSWEKKTESLRMSIFVYGVYHYLSTYPLPSYLSSLWDIFWNVVTDFERLFYILFWVALTFMSTEWLQHLRGSSLSCDRTNLFVPASHLIFGFFRVHLTEDRVKGIWVLKLQIALFYI